MRPGADLTRVEDRTADDPRQAVAAYHRKTAPNAPNSAPA